MVKYPKSQYKFVKFVKSSNPKKKYDAILKNKQTDREVKVSFGSRNMSQYQDRVLGLYKSQDTKDKNRRRAFRSRFSGLKQKQDWNTYYTPLSFAYRLLW
tara:strand:+ start:165 stop:464 length:300 start_codon:yes stop_codon:yes gene_type:complete